MKTLRLPPLCMQVCGAREVVSGQCLMLIVLEMLLTFILCLAVVVVVVAEGVVVGVVVVEACCCCFALSRNVQNLPQHQRAQAAPAAPSARRVDDVEDAVDGSEDDDSDEPPEQDRADDDDEPSHAEVEAGAAAFNHGAWAQVAAFGLSDYHTPVPDCPLGATNSRSSSDFGNEVPVFLRDLPSGAIKGKVANALPSRGCTSTFEFVRLLFSDDMVDKLVNASNSAAAEHPRCKELVRIQRSWKPVDRKEMFLWLALCTYLGVVKIQNRKCAWARRGIFRQKWMCGQMSLERFESILTCVNFCDHWNLSQEEFQRKNSEYVFWQIEELVGLANANSQAYFRVGHRIDIDEAVIPWKGRHKARCYNGKKPWKFHFKKFMCNDADTGYNYNFYYYGGKDETRPDDMPERPGPLSNSCLQHPHLFITKTIWLPLIIGSRPRALPPGLHDMASKVSARSGPRSCHSSLPGVKSAFLLAAYSKRLQRETEVRILSTKASCSMVMEGAATAGSLLGKTATPFTFCRRIRLQPAGASVK